MTVNSDRHIWHNTILPIAGDHLVLSETAGPRAINRTILIHSTADQPITAYLCYQSLNLEVYPEFFECHLREGSEETPQSVLINEKGAFRSLDSSHITPKDKGNTAILAGACSEGIQVWLELEADATEGSVYVEISCQFDS